MIKVERSIRNSNCFIYFLKDITVFGSIQLSEGDAGLIPFLEEAIKKYNESKEDEKPIHITGKN